MDYSDDEDCSGGDEEESEGADAGLPQLRTGRVGGRERGDGWVWMEFGH